MSEEEPSANADAAAQVVDGDAHDCPDPAPCTDDCVCLCGVGHGFVTERLPGPSRPPGVAPQSPYGFVNTMHPGDYIDRIFRPPLSA